MSAEATIVTKLAALNRAAALLCASDDAGVQEVGEAMDAWLAPGADGTFDAAFGLYRGQSFQNWRTIAARAERDRLLGEAAERFGLSAPQLAEQLGRYVSGPWLKNSPATRCPHSADDLAAWFWHAMRSRPIGPRQIENLMRNYQAGLISREV